jgi:hypothetical protein
MWGGYPAYVEADPNRPARARRSSFVGPRREARPRARMSKRCAQGNLGSGPIGWKTSWTGPAHKCKRLVVPEAPSHLWGTNPVKLTGAGRAAQVPVNAIFHTDRSFPPGKIAAIKMAVARTDCESNTLASPFFEPSPPALATKHSDSDRAGGSKCRQIWTMWPTPETQFWSSQFPTRH